MTKRQDALDYHSNGRPGKIAVVPTKPLTNQRDLSLAYSPGVAEPCIEINRDPDLAYAYTAKGNLVAVVTNGTAVLGLGNIGAARRQAGDGGQGEPLQAVRRPRRLRSRGGIGEPGRRHQVLPAARADRRRHQPRGHPRARLLLHRGDAPEDAQDPRLPRRPARHRDHLRRGAAQRARVRRQEHRRDQGRVLRRRRGRDLDRRALRAARREARAHHHVRPRRRRSTTAAKATSIRTRRAFSSTRSRARSPTRSMGADVFVGLSVAGAITGDMVKAMATSPIIFALANPVPEILPEEVRAVRDGRDHRDGAQRLSEPGQQRPRLPVHLPRRVGRPRDGNQRRDEDGGDARARAARQRERAGQRGLAVRLARGAVRPRVSDSLPVRSARAAVGRAGGRVGGGGVRRRARLHRPRRVSRAARIAARAARAA